MFSDNLMELKFDIFDFVKTLHPFQPFHIQNFASADHSFNSDHETLILIQHKYLGMAHRINRVYSTYSLLKNRELYYILEEIALDIFDIVLSAL